MWMWFLPTVQTATLPWRVSGHILETGGCRRVGAGTMHVVLKHEKVRNADKTAAPARLVTSDFDQRALSLRSNVCVSVHMSHIHTHKFQAQSFLHPLSSILVYQSPSHSFSVSVELPVSTGSLSCTRSQPSCSSEAGFIGHPTGSWYIFGLVSLDTSPTVHSIPSTL